MAQNIRPTLLILAAGMGSRYGGLKQVDGVGPNDEAIIDYSIFDAVRAGFGKVVFIIRKDIEEAFYDKIARRWDGKVEWVFAFQEPELGLPADMPDLPKREKPWGTAHAVLAAAEVINEPFAVINADDYYGIEGYRKMADFLQNQCSSTHFSMLGYVLGNTLSDFGTVSRGVCEMDAQHFLTEVNERHKIRREAGGIFYTGENGQDVFLKNDTLVSMNYWGFHPSIFPVLQNDFAHYARANYQNPKSEFYIPLVINRMIREGDLQLSVIPNDDQWYGVTYREDKPFVEKALANLVAAGKYPSPLWSGL
jgi:NDP-sugar pyrophosphorylase family protein